MLLAMAILLGGVTYYSYSKRDYDFRQLAECLFAIIVVLSVFFLLANRDCRWW